MFAYRTFCCLDWYIQVYRCHWINRAIMKAFGTKCNIFSAHDEAGRNSRKVGSVGACLSCAKIALQKTSN